jgi:hypothetical protein
MIPIMALVFAATTCISLMIASSANPQYKSLFAIPFALFFIAAFALIGLVAWASTRTN